MDDEGGYAGFTFRARILARYGRSVQMGVWVIRVDWVVVLVDSFSPCKWFNQEERSYHVIP